MYCAGGGATTRGLAGVEPIFGAGAGAAPPSSTVEERTVVPDTLRCADAAYPELSVFIEPIVSLRCSPGDPPPPAPLTPSLELGGVADWL